MNLSLFQLRFQLSTENSENAWVSLCGSLKDNVSFAEWSDRFWAEKQQDMDEDEILSVEKTLGVI